jgi:hypothetical protein
MVLETNIMGMGIFIKDSILMVYQKVSANILGVMEVIIKETLNKDFEVVMGYGLRNLKKIVKITKDITQMIKNRVMEYISGKMDGYTKEISKMITEMDLGNYMMEKTACIRDTGRMVNKYNAILFWHQKLQKQQQVSK